MNNFTFYSRKFACGKLNKTRHISISVAIGIHRDVRRWRKTEWRQGRFVSSEVKSLERRKENRWRNAE
jgi:hypothetical protein